MNELEQGVQHSINILIRNVRAYVFEEDDSSYRVVATELRKLLLDADAAASFYAKNKGKRSKGKTSLFELCYGEGKRIHIRADVPNSDSKYKPTSPSIYVNRGDILYHSTHGGHLTSLPEWLDKHFVHDSKGTVMKISTVLKYIADKEGAHIINPKRVDKRDEARIAVFKRQPNKVELEDDSNFINHWEQFVIGTGMRLLDARMAVTGAPLIELGILIPSGEQNSVFTIKKSF